MLKILPLIDKETGNLDVNLILRLPEAFKQQHEEFFSNYAIIDLQPNNFEERTLKPKHERTCRFCKKTSGEVSFKKKAHIIPELIGKSTFVSDFECDTCNSLFSTYETDLSAFIGAPRSLSSKKAKQGTPTYKSSDKNLEIRGVQNPATGSSAQISSSDFENDIVINEADKKLIIIADRPTYTPLRVFKALAKIALTLFSDEDFVGYDRLNSMLLNLDDTDSALANCPLCKAMIYVNPGIEFPSPLALIVKKLDEKTPLPTHSLILYFHNYIYQIFLPFYTDDLWMYDGKINVTLMAAPPLVDKGFTERFGEPKLHNVDLSSNEKVKNQKHEIVLSFDSIRKEQKNSTEIPTEEEN